MGIPPPYQGQFVYVITNDPSYVFVFELPIVFQSDICQYQSVCFEKQRKYFLRQPDFQIILFQGETQEVTCYFICIYMPDPYLHLLYTIFLVSMCQVQVKVCCGRYLSVLEIFLLAPRFFRSNRQIAESIFSPYDLEKLIEGRGYAIDIQVPYLRLFQARCISMPLQYILQSSVPSFSIRMDICFLWEPYGSCHTTTSLDYSK